MSYIAPSGNIWLLHNVPIDKTYQNTLYWEIDKASSSATGKLMQKLFFIGTDANPSVYVKRRFTNQYYSRHEKGSIRINELADNLFDCNYLVFQNSSFGQGKYFFAFITSVEYINNAVTQVNFEIDVIQTWYFDFDIEPSFIERMHTNTDVVGENIVAEPLQTGEHEYANIYQDLITGQLIILVAVVKVESTAGGTPTADGTIYSNIYGGTTLFAYDNQDTLSINAKIAEYVQSPDSVVAIYMCPRCLLITDETHPNQIPVGGFKVSSDMVITGVHLLHTTIPQDFGTEPFGSFTPNNKKLYTYPYTYLEVFTPYGASAIYRYEFFNNRTPSFVFGGCVTQPVELTIVPVNYKDINIDSSHIEIDLLMAESVSLKNFPLCSWNVDAYKAWVAQNSVPLGLNALGNAAASAGALAVTGLTGSPLLMAYAAERAVMSGVQNVTNVLSQAYSASIEADKLHGQASGSSAIGMNTHGFFFAKAILNESSARIIDSFFDRFGYAIKKIAPVSRKNRKYYTYVKTLGCTLAGGVPSDDEELISTLHDAGITYWDGTQCRQDSKQVGDFSLASLNTPWAPSP